MGVKVMVYLSTGLKVRQVNPSLPPSLPLQQMQRKVNETMQQTLNVPKGLQLGHTGKFHAVCVYMLTKVIPMPSNQLCPCKVKNILVKHSVTIMPSSPTCSDVFSICHNMEKTKPFDHYNPVSG